MKDEIIRVLKEHTGQHRAIPVAQIVDAIGEIPDGITNPAARTAIREIIDNHELPIGSCSKGYYLIQTEAELKGYLENLSQRAISIAERHNAVKAAFTKYHGK